MVVALQSPITHSHVIGRLTQLADGFNNPVDIAVGQEGRLYVLSRTNMNHAPLNFLRVTVVTIDEEFIEQHLRYGMQDGGLVWPTSIAIDADEHFYVSDEHRHDVQAFDRHGNFITRIGGPGSAPGQLDRPAGVAVHPDGTLLVTDCMNNRVQRFSRTGEHLAVIGGPGTGSGELNMPWGIGVDRADNIYVSDWGNDRVQKLDPDGLYLQTFGTPGRGEGQLHRPSGVGVDSKGAVYVSDYGNDRVQVFEPDGTPLVTLLGDAMPSKWGLEAILVDQEAVEIREKYAEDVEAQERVFEGPMGIEVDDQDRVLIVDCCKHRVQIYQRH